MLSSLPLTCLSIIANNVSPDERIPLASNLALVGNRFCSLLSCEVYRRVDIRDYRTDALTGASKLSELRTKCREIGCIVGGKKSLLLSRLRSFETYCPVNHRIRRVYVRKHKYAMVLIYGVMYRFP